MHVGIVVAVSEYKGDASPLPACKRDGEVLFKILKSDPKFNEVLLIDSDTSASHVKAQMADIVARLKGQEIEDIVFYYTGHGAFVGDEFYFLLSDYSQKRLNQTALANKELDSLVRALSPKNFIKIVDACQSGFHYIKSRDALTDSFKAGVNAFKSVYFMFSSQADQSSYQDAFLSDFTESIIRAIYEKPEGRIRYKDIIDVVSDDFSSSLKQSPIFVTQADFTDIFCEVSPSLKKIMEPFIRDVNQSNARKQSTISRVDLIKDDAERYCDEDTTTAALERMAEIINEIFLLSTELSALFSQIVDKKSGIRVIDAAEVGKMIGGGKDFFAKPEYEARSVKKRVPKNRFSVILGNIGDSDYDTIEEMQNFIIDYKSEVNLPFDHLEVRNEPKYPNLPLAKAFIAPIVSRTKIKLFYNYVFYNYRNWTNRTSFKKEGWSSEEFETRDEAATRVALTQIHEGYVQFITDYLDEIWGIEADVKN